jgi:orotate phosphoribosyltransferase/AMMECR1 domain-containing protein
MKTLLAPVTTTAPTLQQLLAVPDDVLERRVIELIRKSGVKFRSQEEFRKIGWQEGPAPMYAKFVRREGGRAVPSPEPLLWDLRAPLLQDEMLSCCCVLLWRRSRIYDAQWIGGVESAAIPIVAGMLAVNRAAGGPPLNGFYLRKKRKPDGLRRLLEGVRPPHGTRVLLIDDILNKGISKKRLLTYCNRNSLKPEALLVVIDTHGAGHELFRSICPIEALFVRRDVLSDFRSPPQANLVKEEAAILVCNQATDVIVHSRECASKDRLPTSEMSAEDIELVRLARDTVIFSALSRGKDNPTLGADKRGSAGYLPFLGRYLWERGPVFTRISKREFKDGVWFNRMRGCQAVGLFDRSPGTIAEMTMKSAIVSATRARKVKRGPAVFHKPIWPEEIGDLSLFVYIIERFVPTKARTAEELISEGHDVHGWGLVAEANGYRGVICGDLKEIPDVARQIAVACRKMQNSREIHPIDDASKVRLTRIKGRWLWDPARPKSAFF